MHELYRARYKYFIISFLVLLGSAFSVFFIEERYESSFELTVNPDIYDSLSANIKLNQLYNRLQAGSNNKSSQLDVIRKDSNLLIRYSDLSAELAYEKAMDKALEISNDPKVDEQYIDITNALSFEKNELANLKEQLLVVQSEIQTLNAIGSTGDNSINNRIYDVQSQLDNAKISYQVTTTKLNSLNKQLKNEAKFLTGIKEIQKLRRSLVDLNKKISEKQSIIDDYQNNNRSAFDDETVVISAVVSDMEQLKSERKRITKKIEEQENNENNLLIDDAGSKNLYSELRSQIAMTEIEKGSLASRIESLKANLSLLEHKGLDQASVQKKLNTIRINENGLQASVSKVQDHIKQLEIKQADLKKQASTFLLINQPYKARKYSGVGKSEVLFGGYMAFILVPLLLSISVVFFDTKIRTDRALKSILPVRVAVLETIPHFSSPKTARSVRKAYFSIAIWLISVVVIYTAIGSFGVNT